VLGVLGVKGDIDYKCYRGYVIGYRGYGLYSYLGNIRVSSNIRDYKG